MGLQHARDPGLMRVPSNEPHDAGGALPLLADLEGMTDGPQEQRDEPPFAPTRPSKRGGVPVVLHDGRAMHAHDERSQSLETKAD